MSPLIEFKAKPRIEEALYPVKFVKVEVFPKTVEDCAKMNFKEQQYSWTFQIVQPGKYFNDFASGLTPLRWTPKNRLGKWISILGIDAQPGEGVDLDKYAGKELMAHIVNYESKRSGSISYQVKEIFPAAGISGGIVAASTLAQPAQQAAQPAPTTTGTQPAQQGAVTSTAEPAKAEPKKPADVSGPTLKKKINF